MQHERNEPGFVRNVIALGDGDNNGKYSFGHSQLLFTDHDYNEY